MIPRNLIMSIAAMVLITVGMTFYVWHMRGRVLSGAPANAPAEVVTPPVAGPVEPVTLYLAYDDKGVLKAQSFRIPLPSQRQARAEELIHHLISIYTGNPSPHPLGSGSDLRSVFIIDPDIVVIDVNAAFSTGHPSGVLAEELTVTSLVESLSANVPGIKRVKILVDGKTQDTLAGHADLTEFYDVANVHNLAMSLQAGQ